MIIASVAIGKQYELEAERLKRSIEGVYVFTESDKQYKRVNEDNLINGLYHKTNFANYLKGKKTEPVLFCDADLFGLIDNPLETFKPKEDTDIAFVPYSGKWYLPDAIRQKAFDHFGYKINSGFIYFRTLEIAQDVCNRWREAYLEREKLYDVAKGTSKYEYDEWALMIALMDTGYKIEILDKKWNVWELKTEEEIKNSDSILFQSHDHLDIV